MQTSETNEGEARRGRAITVLNALAGARRGAGTLAEVVHDARNMGAALSLYCDLMAEPGVLAEGYGNYAAELRLVAAASHRLTEKLALFGAEDALSAGGEGNACRAARPASCAGRLQPVGEAAGRLPGDPIENLQQEVLANRNLLAAIVGAGVRISVRTEGGARPVRLAPEDLTRILVNLVKNAAEAMHSAGSVEITVRDLPRTCDREPMVVLVVEDSGPGIAEDLLERVFEPGFTTRGTEQDPEDEGWRGARRGLGLSIIRSIIEQAGGRVSAANPPAGGAQIRLEMPVRRSEAAR